MKPYERHFLFQIDEDGQPDMVARITQIDSRTDGASFKSHTGRWDAQPDEGTRDEMIAKLVEELSYAVSIHKSQGSEYPAVVIPVMTQHYAMLERNLLYTGVTRGRSLVVLVGQKKAVAIAVRGVRNRRR